MLLANINFLLVNKAETAASGKASTKTASYRSVKVKFVIVIMFFTGMLSTTLVLTVFPVDISHHYGV